MPDRETAASSDGAAAPATTPGDAVAEPAAQRPSIGPAEGTALRDTPGGDAEPTPDAPAPLAPETTARPNAHAADTAPDTAAETAPNITPNITSESPVVTVVPTPAETPPAAPGEAGSEPGTHPVSVSEVHGDVTRRPEGEAAPDASGSAAGPHTPKLETAPEARNPTVERRQGDGQAGEAGREQAANEAEGKADSGTDSEGDDDADDEGVDDGPLLALPDDDTEYLGTLDDATPAVWRDSPVRQYDPAAYLVGLLREAYLVSSKWQVPTQLEADGQAVLVDAARNVACAAVSLDDLEALASRPLTRREKVRTLTDEDVERFTHADEDQPAVQEFRLDDLLWRCALRGAIGRMPRGTDPQRTLYLRHWPNLTRTIQPPDAPRLAALFALRGSSLADATQLKLPQRHIVAFINGAWALNLLTDDGSLARRMQRKGARNRGLLSRLLGWLRR
jgi:hypothetical protein